MLLKKGLEFLHAEALNLVRGEIFQQIDELFHLTDQLIEIPFLRRQVRIHIGLHDFSHGAFAVTDHLLLQSTAIQHSAAFGIHRTPLVVHHLVVLEHLLADVVVVGLHLLLSSLQRTGEHAGFNRHVFLHAEGIHQTGNAITAEDPQQVVAQ